MNRFADKVVIVTAAAQGIGAAIAERFAAEGAALAVCDIQAERLAAKVDGLNAAGAKVMSARVDVAEPSETENFVKEAHERFGRIDVLINNAGWGSFGPVTELNPELWRRAFAISVDSIFHACRVAIPILTEVGGCVVNTCSISGLHGDYGLAAYCSAKGAVANLTRAMAIDHARDGVRINAVAPGGVDTEGAAALKHPLFDREYAKLIPMGRMARPVEVAGAVAFLASSDASYITGVNLVVDGGVTAATGQPNFRAIGAEIAALG